MKKSLLRALLSVTALAGMAAGIHAEDYFDASGFRCTINPDGTTVSVAAKPMTGYSAQLEIPDYVISGSKQYDVTGISDDAFKNNVQIEQVTLGKNVTKIGANAFLGCSYLTKVLKCSGVTEMGAAAFRGCKKLEKASFAALERVPDEAFWFCSGLTSADFPVAETVGARAFRECTALATVNFPVLTYIGEAAFLQDSSLTEFTFNDKVNIGASAFYLCYSLKELLLPYQVTAIGANAFTDCTGLEEIYILNDNYAELNEANPNGLMFNTSKRKIYCTGQLYDYVSSTFGQGMVVNLNTIMVPTFTNVSATAFNVSFKAADIPGNVFSALSVMDASGATLRPTDGIYSVSGTRCLVSYGFYDKTLTYFVTPEAGSSIADIAATPASGATVTGCYDLQGRALPASAIKSPSGGIVIVRYSDGTTRRLLPNP